MKTKCRRFFSLVLSVVLFAGSLSVSAHSANYTTNYHQYSAPSSSDYAYWNGYSVKRASGTTTSEVKWMQAALNYCIEKEGLDAAKLDVDGSFGPASRKTTLAFQKATGLEQDGSFGPSTIKKMKAVLGDGKATFKTNSKSNSKISSDRIQSVLDQYKYKDGWYWVYSSGGSRSSGYTATTQNRGRSFSYDYKGSVECAGFAAFVMTKVTGSYAYGGKGWTKIAGESNITELRVGDIIRTSTHSAVVLSINSDGTITFAECWGSVNCMINIGKFDNCCTTLKQIKDRYTVSHIWRYTG